MILNIESYEQMEGPRDEVGVKVVICFSIKSTGFPFKPYHLWQVFRIKLDLNCTLDMWTI